VEYFEPGPSGDCKGKYQNIRRTFTKFYGFLYYVQSSVSKIYLSLFFKKYLSLLTVPELWNSIRGIYLNLELQGTVKKKYQNRRRAFTEFYFFCKSYRIISFK